MTCDTQSCIKKHCNVEGDDDDDEFFGGMVNRRKAFSVIPSRDHDKRDPHFGESPTRREQDGMHPMHKLSKDGAVRTA